jgi:5'-nucleotidase
MLPSRLAYAFLLTLIISTAAAAQNIHVKVIAFNDFHGNLQSPGKMRSNAQSPEVPVGGVDFLAGYVEHLKSENPNSIVVAGGDIVGASPLVSALFHDEPTIEAMNRLGLDLTSVGNHEFDNGRRELLRKQNGGCSTQDKNTCEGAQTGTPVPFEGAKFKYFAANVVDTSTGKTLFPPYSIKTYGGIRIAFIGLVLQEAPTIISPSGIAGLRFIDEAVTTNAIVKKLRRQGIKSFVVLIHQGAGQTTKGIVDINACEGGLHGSAIASIVNKLDPAVALVVSAHSHQAYICEVPNSIGRSIPVTSAASYGRLVTDIDLTINKHSKTITAVTAHNILIDRTNPAIKADAAIKALVDKYTAIAAPLQNRVVGSVTAAITRKFTAAGESVLGDLIADVELDTTRDPATGSAVIAFMNTGGVRADLPFASGIAGIPDGEVTYGELFTIQPFGNVLTTMTLTGGQIKTVLEEQFKGCAQGFPPDQSTPPNTNRMLQVSEGFTYTWNPSAAPCSKVDPASIKLNGVVLAPSAKYRVTVNDFVAGGGDQFFAFTGGTDRFGGPPDLDAMTAYFAKHPSVSPPETHRITVTSAANAPAPDSE